MANNYKIVIDATVNEAQLQKQIETVNAKAQRSITTVTKQLGTAFDTITTTTTSKKGTATKIVNDYASAQKRATQESKNFSTASKDASKQTNILGQSLLSASAKFTAWYLISGVVTSFIRGLKDVVTQVKELDLALVELNKVANLTAKQEEEVTEWAFKMGNQLAKVGTDVIDAATEFKRAGYTLQDSMDLAEVAVKMTNVAEGITDAGTAAEYLISILKGANLEISYASKLLDELNEVSNNSAIGFDELANMMQRASGTMTILGNTTEETMALLTGAYEVLQDERVAKGISVIGLRIAGLNEDLSEEEGLASNVGEALQKYADIDVMGQNGQLKDTYDILSELAEKWDGLTKNAQTYLLTTLAGKNRADVLASIMNNWEGVQEAIVQISESSDSAEQEQAAYLDSIAGKVEKLQNAWQELSTTTMSSDMVKNLTDFARWLLEIGNQLGGIQSILVIMVPLILTLKSSQLITFILGLTNQVAVLNGTLYAGTSAANAFTISLTAMKVALGAITALIGITMIAIGRIKQAEEKRKQAIEEATTSARENYTEEMQTIQDLEEQYIELYNVTTKTETQKNKLLTITEQLVNAYGLEEEALAKLSDGTATAEEVYASFIETRKKELQDYLDSVYTTYEEAKTIGEETSRRSLKSKGQLSQSTKYGVKGDLEKAGIDVNALDQMALSGNYTDEEWLNALGEQRSKLIKFLDENPTINADSLYAEDREAYSAITGYLDQLTTEIDSVSSSMEENQSIIDEYEQAQGLLDFYNNMSDKVTELESKLNDFNNMTLSEQADSYQEMQDYIDNLIKLYPQYKDEIKSLTEAFDEEVASLKEQDFLLNAMEDKLDTLNELKTAQEEELEQQQKLLKVEQARAALAEAQNKKIQVYRMGQGMVYESDTSAVQEAQENLADAINDAGLDELSVSIDNLTDAIEAYNSAQLSQTENGVSSMRDYFLSSANVADFMSKSLEEQLAILENFASGTIDTTVTGEHSSDYYEKKLGLQERRLAGAYADGTTNSKDGLSLVGEQGAELVDMNKGSTVFPADITKNLMDFGKNPSAMISNVSNQNSSNTVVQNFDKIVLPNVTNVEEFANEIMKVGRPTKSQKN